jgi:hypothetical protein
MKRATVIAGWAFVIFIASPAYALKTIVATVALGKVQVSGVQAQRNADITWEGNVVTKSNSLGLFAFSTPDLPIDCVGQLSDGVSTIPVVIFGCTTQPVSGAGVLLKTGQTTSFAPGDDGDIQAGAPVPNPRFTDNGDGTVTDHLTALIWLKNASCLGLSGTPPTPTTSWGNAVAFANALADGNVPCGLTDGSVAGDWRLPNRNELLSLVDLGGRPTLPAGHPFVNFAFDVMVCCAPRPAYWSSTTSPSGLSAWVVAVTEGMVWSDTLFTGNWATAVRGGR